MVRTLFRTLSIVGALSACVPATAGAANTWAGVWNSDFGRMTLDAGGSGSYAGFSPGTVSGSVTGDVNQGTWNQPGTPPRSGTFKFTLSSNGGSFTGEWAYDAGGCGIACGWNGTCIEGPCLQNGTSTPCLASTFRAPGPLVCFDEPTSPTVRPQLGQTTSYTAPLPGKTAAIPTPVLGRKDKTAVVEIGTSSQTGVAGAAPPVVGVELTVDERRAFKALQLCYILVLAKDAADGLRSYISCAATVQKILKRNDEIQAKKRLGKAAQAAKAQPCRSVTLKRRGKRLRGAAQVRCEVTATGLRLGFTKRRGGPSLRSLFGRKSRLVVGRSRFDAPVAFGDRVNVLWRSQNP